jgi:hypothetical protein
MGVLVVASALICAYWAAWFLDRGLVATEHLGSYYQFEEAFPAADAWLVGAAAGAWAALARRRPTALLWLLAGGGAGLYLLLMDVLYDLEHGVWAKGAAGLVEAAINLVTAAVSVGLLWWGWTRREALLAQPH